MIQPPSSALESTASAPIAASIRSFSGSLFPKMKAPRYSGGQESRRFNELPLVSSPMVKPRSRFSTGWVPLIDFCLPVKA